MAKSCNQKGKILYLERMLSETTSEKPVSMQEILTKLEEPGIRAISSNIYFAVIPTCHALPHATI